MIKLDQKDWQILFKTETFKLGQTKLELRPLSLRDIPKVVGDIAKIVETCKQKGLSVETWADNFQKVILSILPDVPGLLSVMSGLDPDDISKLPLAVALELAKKCLQVNLDDVENLLKNLTALVEALTEMLTLKENLLEG